MIQVEKLSYGFPDKDLYKDISFTLAAGQHCALIGSNGCGKSTLVDLLMRPDKYWFDGKVLLDEGCPEFSRMCQRHADDGGDQTHISQNYRIVIKSYHVYGFPFRISPNMRLP